MGGGWWIWLMVGVVMGLYREMSEVIAPAWADGNR